MADGGIIDSSRLERFLGKETLDAHAAYMRGWYGPSIPLAVPGRNKIEVTADGDFRGKLTDGFFASMHDRFDEMARYGKRAFERYADSRANIVGMGFTGLTDFLSESVNSGKNQRYWVAFSSTGATASRGTSMWTEGNFPTAGAAPAAAPGGTVNDNTTTGGLSLNANPTLSGDTEHFLRAEMAPTSGGFGLLLYDRIFSVLKTMNSTATEAVTGVPNRYTSTTVTDPDFCGGNFVFPEVYTVLPATAHNWTVCQYTNQAGTTAQTLPSVTGNASAPVPSLDLPNGTWFAPLASGDYGIKALSQMQCSALVATGSVGFTIGHPIAWIPMPMIGARARTGGVNYQVNLARIFTGACLAFIEPPKTSATGVFYTGMITTVRG